MKVVRKHNNSQGCFICGLDNPFGLKTRYYELENQTLVSVCKGDSLHNSYKGRMHGGIISALLDEGIGRAINIIEPDTFGVTTDLQIKYKKPVPLEQTLYCVAKIIKNNRFLFEGVGLLTDQEGNILAKGTARYMKLAPNQITNEDFNSIENWFLESNNDDPVDIDLPSSLFEELT